MRFFLALCLAKISARMIHVAAKERGTSFPGQLALKIDPGFISHVRGIDRTKTVFVTGTNGKSTSTHLIHHILSHAGHRVCSNLSGANLLSGVATALAEDCTLTGRVRADMIVMETDERYLKMIRQQLPAGYICLTNIQRDQAQRNGEPSFVRDQVLQALDENVTLIVNKDEPNAYALEGRCGRTVSYGVAENSRSFEKADDFFSVGAPCPRCHNPLRFRKYNLENIGPFRCPCCGFGDGPADYQAEDVDFEGQRFSIGGASYALRLSTPYFLYCYTMAVALASELGVPRAKIADALEAFSDIHGLVEPRTVGGKHLRYIKMKQENSETLQSAADLAARSGGDAVLLYHTELLELYPPYANAFYLFDCDFHGLERSGVRKWACMSQALNRAMALRLLYDGVPEEDILLIPDSEETHIPQAVERMDAEQVSLLAELSHWDRLGGDGQ